jgi:hypothetical protein
MHRLVLILGMLSGCGLDTLGPFRPIERPTGDGETEASPTSEIDASASSTGTAETTASSTGAEPICDEGHEDCETCMMCAAGACADEAQACGSSEACIDYNECVDQCKDRACLNECEETFAEGYALQQAVFDCRVCQQCPDACDEDASDSCDGGHGGD